MAALLVRKLLERVSGTLSDASPQFTRYSEGSMVIAAQAGSRALHKYVPHVGTRLVTVKLETGTRQSIARIPAARLKDSAGAMPAADLYGLSLQDVHRNRGAAGTAVGRAIVITDKQRLDRGDPNWHSRTGEAVVREFAYSPADPLTFWVNPPVVGDVWVDASVISAPKVIPPPTTTLYAATGSNNEDMGVDDQWEDELWNYCCAVLLMSDAKATNAMSRAAVHAQAFTGSINTIVQQLTGQNPNLKVLPLTPDLPGAAS
jgi:hypothetical protein